MKSLFLSLILLPVFAFGQVVQGGNAIVHGAVNGPGGGGGTGPYSPTSFTSGAVLIGGGTGPITATGITGTTGGASLTATAATDLTLNAGSGNQNVVINPTGTGALSVSGAGTSAATSIGVVNVINTSNNAFNSTLSNYAPNLTAGNVLTFSVGKAASSNNLGYMGFAFAGSGFNTNALTWGFYSNDRVMSLLGNGVLLLGTTTDNSNGKVQLVSSTSSAGGIGFGSDTAIYRSAANTLTLPSNITFNASVDTSITAPAAANLILNSSTSHSVILKPGGTTALTLDSSLNATFAGSVSIAAIGSTLSIKSGTNAKAGTFTLSSGAVTVANTSVTSNSVIKTTLKTANGARAVEPLITPTAATGFTAAGTATDNGVYNYIIEEVN